MKSNTNSEKMKDVISKMALSKSMTFEEKECAICARTSYLMRPPKGQGYMPTFCTICIEDYKNYPQKKYIVTFIKEIPVEHEILAPDWNTAKMIAEGQIESEVVCEQLWVENKNWYIKSIEEVAHENRASTA